MKYYLGMDIGGTKCAVVLSDESAAEIKDKIRFDTCVSRGYRAIIDELVFSAETLMRRNGLESKDFFACGISCGGPLDSDRGIIMRPPNLPDWDNVPLADIVSGRLGIKCKVRNDADACAIAEWQFGAGRGINNLIFLTFGTGMGAGLILNGRPYSGESGTAGEAGHIRLTPTGPVGYGKAGSFEGYCSGGGIVSLAKLMLNDYSGETAVDTDNLSAKSVAAAADNGDEFALSVYKECGRQLGRGLSILIDVINPGMIVIGSIYQRSSHLMKDEMMKAIKEEALDVNAAACKIVPAALGEKIGDFAAIGIAKEYTEAEGLE